MKHQFSEAFGLILFGIFACVGMLVIVGLVSHVADVRMQHHHDAPALDVNIGDQASPNDYVVVFWDSETGSTVPPVMVILRKYFRTAGSVSYFHVIEERYTSEGIVYTLQPQEVLSF